MQKTKHKAIHIRIVTAVAAVLLATLATATAAVDGYRSALLHDMAAAMKMADSIENLSEGTHVAELSYLVKPVTIIVKRGKVSHIGYSIFTKEHRELAHSPFFDMVERYALMEKLPMQRLKSVDRELLEEGIHFDQGSLSILPPLYDQPDVEFTLENLDGKKYRATWRKNDRDIAVVNTPYTYGLLHGTTMDENEENLVADLRMLSSTQLEAADWTKPSVIRAALDVYTPATTPAATSETETSAGPSDGNNVTGEISIEENEGSYTITDLYETDEEQQDDESQDPQSDEESDMDPDADKIFVRQGKTYYFDSLNSNRYYTIDNDSIVPLCDPAHPFESIANMLTSMEVPNSLVADVDIKRYNYKTDTVSLPLSAMVKYFLDLGCTPFVGLLEGNADNTVALLIMRNEDEGYCQLLRITVPASAYGAKEGAVTARLSPYIPISKITALFAEPLESQQVKSPRPRLFKNNRKPKILK